MKIPTWRRSGAELLLGPPIERVRIATADDLLGGKRKIDIEIARAKLLDLGRAARLLGAEVV